MAGSRFAVLPRGMPALLLVAFAGADLAVACAPPPPAVTTIALPRFYADKEGSEVDPKLKAAHAAAVEPLTAYLRHVVADADRSLRGANPAKRAEAGRCASLWLAAWADAGALTGRMETRQAEYQRKFDFVGLALAWVKVRPHASEVERRAIDAWLIRLADLSRAFFDDRGRKRNNHWYWLGAGLAATATTTDSERHWKLAREIYADAAREITAEGFLPMELERKSRALYYHAFALMPLVTMAELASARGENWASLGDDALHRLAERTRAGLLDSGPFDKRAGAAQERPLKPGAGWLELYAIRHADRLQSPRVDMPPGHRWLGGDVRLLAEALKPRAN